MTLRDGQPLFVALVGASFVAGVIYGLLFLIFGILSPVAVGLGSALPTAFIGVLGGLALLRALQSWMASAFGGDLTLGALTAFLVTLSGISIFHIGAAFWGLVFGVATSWLLERGTLPKAWEQQSFKGEADQNDHRQGPDAFC